MSGRLVAGPPTTPAARRRWLEHRKHFLSASDIATILGLAPPSWGTSPLQVWLEKTDPDHEQDEPTERMLWGLRLERPIADEFRVRHARRLGVYVAPTPGLIASVEHPHLACTPDRVLLDAATRTTALGLLEIKTQGHTIRAEWRDGVPYHYQIQTQVQMGVTGLPYCYVVPLFGGNHMPEPHLLKFDPEAFAMITEITGQWWQRHIVERVPPDPVVGDEPFLPEVWPGDGSTAVLEDTLASRLALRQRMRRRIKQLEDAVARVDLDVKRTMRDAGAAYDMDGNKVATWTRYERKYFDQQALAEAYPEIAAQFTRRITSQRFNVTVAEAEEQ
jgi:putative phage-type endonuclease